MEIDMSAAALKLVQDERITCMVCGHRDHSLLEHIQDHGMTVAEYGVQYPGSPTISAPLMAAWEAENRGVRRSVPCEIEDLTVDLYGLAHPVNYRVPASLCGVKPQGYIYPQKGDAAAAMKRVTAFLRRGNVPVFFFGAPGTGKDVAFEAWSADTRTPMIKVAFTDATNVKHWFYSRSIDPNRGTGWDFGVLWNALTVGVNGVAPLIVFSDVDRAKPAQLEELRLMLDTNGKSITGPSGERVPVMEGVRFAFTANSNGNGDSTGKYSARRMDTSMLDRMGHKIQASYMDWEEEASVLRSKFPALAESIPTLFDELGGCVKVLRQALEGTHSQYDLEGEFTHRSLLLICDAADMEHFTFGEAAPLGRAFETWVNGLDDDNRLIARRLIDPHITGGAFGKKN